MIESKKVIFFDGQCNLCNGFVNFTMRYNQRRNLYFSSLQSDYARNILKKEEINLSTFSTIYYRDANQIFSQSDAIQKISQELDGWPKLIGLALKLIPKTFRDWIYRNVSKNRYRIFGKTDTCRIPEGWEKDFFLD